MKPPEPNHAAPHPLERKLSYRFVRPTLLQEALTHSTYANEVGPRGVDYERLEFLGDAVLGLVVSRALFADYPEEREGTLSRRRALVVREASLATVAEALGLGAFIRAGQGQCDAGFSPSILADVLEAVMAAVFLDGGLAACETAFLPHLADCMRRAAERGEGQDDKTKLQELCHLRQLPPPAYRVVAEEGPSHGRTFVVELRVGSLPPQQGRGRSKKIAEQRCAQQLHAWLLGKPTS